MSASKRPEKKTDWSEFYKNGVPKEIICIDITPDRDDPKTRLAKNPSVAMPASKADLNGAHIDKRRRVEASKAYSYHEPADPAARTPYYADEETPSHHTNSSGRTASRPALTYSTAPTTSLGSQSSGERQRLQRLDDARIGEKRKRPSRSGPRDDSELEVVAQHHLWSNYVPPPKPPIKAQDVYVQVFRDVSLVLHKSTFPCTHS